MKSFTAIAGGVALIITLALTGAAITNTTSETRLDSIQALRLAYAGPARQWPAPWIDKGIAYTELGALAPPLPQTDGEQRRAALGARLFHDPILSVANNLTCSSCHDQRQGWSSASFVAHGGQGSRGRRNPPSLFGVGQRPRLGWDGRKDSLAVQSLIPITAPDEMGNRDVASVLRRLSNDPSYARDFSQAYGKDAISARNLGDSLAIFQAPLEQVTRFDRFASVDRQLLSDRELRGLHLFRTKARCANCHFGPRLTDDGFHNLRISSFGEKAQDLGRYNVTHHPRDAGRFRTASLRHIGQTAPYMHNGLFLTLEGVINLYDRGGGEVWARNAAEASAPLYPFASRVSSHIRPLSLSAEEKEALAAFLRTL